MTAKFTLNSKIYSVTKMSLFMVNYSRELRMGMDIRRKKKVEKVTEFVKRIKKVQEETEAVLRKIQEKIKRQADKRRKKVQKWKKRTKVILSTKNLVFKERLAKKRYIELYEVEEIILENTIKLKLLASIRIYLMVNVSWVVKYKEQVEEQKVERSKTSRSWRSWRMESGKNIQQNKSKKSDKVFGTIEEVYSRV